jgi:hypothetical protein
MAETQRTSGSRSIPENAEHEIKLAYYSVISTATMLLWDHSNLHGIDFRASLELYTRAYKALRNGEPLTGERWARAARHLAQAHSHEAKIAFLEPRTNILPFLENAKEEYDLREHSDTAADLLDSVEHHPPPGMSQMPADMKRFYERGRLHLEALKRPGYDNELLRTERIKAAHEYGRVVELMALAYESESYGKKSA